MDWIFYTLFAAFMQAVRTAGQKHLVSNLSVSVVTWSRYGFGLPPAILYLIFCYWKFADSPVTFGLTFWVYTFVAALAQVIATGLLVKLFSLRNFAVGTTYAKTEAILAAVLATILFGKSISLTAWIAVLIGALGVMFVTLQKSQNPAQGLKSHRQLIYGLGAGVMFAITSVFIREANLVLDASTELSAAIILVLSLLIQGIISTIWVHWENPKNWQLIKSHSKTGWFIGLTGTLGSIGWYTAFGFQEAALVKTLGQIEFLFTILLTIYFFREKISKAEWVGMIFVLVAILFSLQ